MSSSQHGTTTSGIVVTDISPDGLWVLISDEEIFMPFDEFPWFKNATVEEILNVVEVRPVSYSWPDLDIDLGLDSIRNPERYPLKARVDA